MPGVDEKLIIVAHSMGGNIVYDILTHYMPDLVCDLFLTVGSQVGLLEELKLFHASDRAIPTKERPKVPRGPTSGGWLRLRPGRRLRVPGRADLRGAQRLLLLDGDDGPEGNVVLPEAGLPRAAQRPPRRGGVVMPTIFPAARPDASTPQTHALVVGVNDYPHLLNGSLHDEEPAAPRWA